MRQPYSDLKVICDSLKRFVCMYNVSRVFAMCVCYLCITFRRRYVSRIHGFCVCITFWRRSVSRIHVVCAFSLTCCDFPYYVLVLSRDLRLIILDLHCPIYHCSLSWLRKENRRARPSRRVKPSRWNPPEKRSRLSHPPEK